MAKPKATKASTTGPPSDEDGRQVDARVDKALREIGDEIMSEPVPQRLLDILRRKTDGQRNGS